MLQGQGRIVHKWTAIMGIVLGVIGIVGAAAPVVPGSAVLAICQSLALPYMGLWFIIVGVLLRRYGRKLARSNG